VFGDEQGFEFIDAVSSFATHELTGRGWGSDRESGTCDHAEFAGMLKMLGVGAPVKKKKKPKPKKKTKKKPAKGGDDDASSDVDPAAAEEADPDSDDNDDDADEAQNAIIADVVRRVDRDNSGSIEFDEFFAHFFGREPDPPPEAAAAGGQGGGLA
jgi:hypothetical protein